MGCDDTKKEVSDQVLADRLADATRRIEEGKAARRERDDIIQELDARGWTQEQIAAAARVSQPAISQRLTYLARLKAKEKPAE